MHLTIQKYEQLQVEFYFAASVYQKELSQGPWTYSHVGSDGDTGVGSMHKKNDSEAIVCYSGKFSMTTTVQQVPKATLYYIWTQHSIS